MLKPRPKERERERERIKFIHGNILGFNMCISTTCPTGQEKKVKTKLNFN